MRAGVGVPAVAEEIGEGEVGQGGGVDQGEVGLKEEAEVDPRKDPLGAKDHEVRKETKDQEVKRGESLGLKAGIGRDQEAERNLLHLVRPRIKEWSRKMLLTALMSNVRRRFRTCLQMRVQEPYPSKKRRKNLSQRLQKDLCPETRKDQSP